MAIKIGEYKLKNAFTMIVEHKEVIFEAGESITISQCDKEKGLCVSSGDNVIDIPKSLQETFMANVDLIKDLGEEYDEEDADEEDEDEEEEEDADEEELEESLNPERISKIINKLLTNKNVSIAEAILE